MAHVAAGDEKAEKGVELGRAPTKTEAFMTKLNASWFGQLSLVKSEWPSLHETLQLVLHKIPRVPCVH